MGHLASVAAWCGLGGSLVAVASYLVLDITPFGGDIIQPGSLQAAPDVGAPLVPLLGPRLALLPDILIRLLLTRSPLLLLTAAILLFTLGKGWRRLALLLGLGVPLLCEFVLAAVHFDASWLGMLWALAVNWPSRPEYVVPFGFAARATASHVLPALAYGAAGWLAATRLMARKDRVPAA